MHFANDSLICAQQSIYDVKQSNRLINVHSISLSWFNFHLQQLYTKDDFTLYFVSMTMYYVCTHYTVQTNAMPYNIRKDSNNRTKTNNSYSHNVKRNVQQHDRLPVFTSPLNQWIFSTLWYWSFLIWIHLFLILIWSKKNKLNLRMDSDFFQSFFLRVIRKSWCKRMKQRRKIVLFLAQTQQISQ